MFFERIRKEKEKSRAAGVSDKRRTELTRHKCFKWGFVDHIIAKYMKPPKDNEKWQKKVRFSERGNRKSHK